MISFRGQKLIVFTLIIFIFFSIIFSSLVKKTSMNFNGITIVIDAGHGGRDGGSVGITGIIEKNINLEYALSLKDKLSKVGYKVIMTRTTDIGLYSSFAKNKKVSDMNARMQIIKKANPSLVVSIHMNSFTDKTVKGANTYYKVDDNASKTCADLVQASLNKYCDAKNTLAKEGDYFMLNCSYYTSILVECGFLSNAEEELNLITEEYKEKVVNAIYYGILLYFGNNDLGV